MNRRASLSAVGVGTTASLGGCASLAAPTTSPSETSPSETSPSETSPSETSAFERRSVSVTGTDPLPDDLPIDLSVQTDRSGATEEATVAFRVTLTNDADATREFDVGSIPTPNLLGTYSDPASYVLLQPPPYWRKADRRAYCWENDEPDEDPYRVVPKTKRVDLPPGESHSAVASLWGSVDDESCWPAGEFAFAGPVSVAGSTFPWGFQFEVSEP